MLNLGLAIMLQRTRGRFALRILTRLWRRATSSGDKLDGIGITSAGHVAAGGTQANGQTWVAVYDDAGDEVWRDIGGTGSIFDLTAGAGLVVTSGQNGGQARFVAYDEATGDALWALQFETATAGVQSGGNEVAIMPDGNVAASIIYSGTVGIPQTVGLAHSGDGGEDSAALVISPTGGILRSIPYNATDYSRTFIRALTVDAGRVYLGFEVGNGGDNEARVVAFDVTTALPIWTRTWLENGDNSAKGLASGEAGIYVSLRLDGQTRVELLDRDTGATLESRTLTGSSQGAECTAFDGGVLLGVTQDSPRQAQIVALGPDLATVWTEPLHDDTSSTGVLAASGEAVATAQYEGPVGSGAYAFARYRLRQQADETPAPGGSIRRPDAVLSYGLNGVADWSTTMHFLNILKAARTWEADLLADNTPENRMRFEDFEAAGLLDQNGYPTAIPSGYSSIRTGWDWGGVSDEMAASRAGTYVLRYDGEGTVGINGAATLVSSAPGEMVFSTSGGGNMWITIEATDPNGTGDHIRNMSVVRQDRVALYDSGATFNPDYLALHANSREIRFMDMQETNNSHQRVWADRPLPEDSHYRHAGVPLEVLVSLANELDADPWFCMPHQANDDYIRNFAEYVRDNQDPGLLVHVEFSNEAWNWGFQQTSWFRDQALENWGADQSHPHDYYAKRATESALIWNAVFGAEAETRLVHILGAFTQNPWLTGILLEAANWQANEPDNHVAPHSVFDEVAVTTYFGSDIISVDAERDALIAAIQDPDVDATAYLTARLMSSDLQRSVPNTAARLREQVDIVHPYGLRLSLYEGGSHVQHSGGNAPSADRDIYNPFLVEYSYSDDMADLYEALWDAWVEIGDGPFMQFVDVAKPGPYGSWGLRRYLGDDNPRALRVEQLASAATVWWGDPDPDAGGGDGGGGNPGDGGGGNPGDGGGGTPTSAVLMVGTRTGSELPSYLESLLSDTAVASHSQGGSIQNHWNGSATATLDSRAGLTAGDYVTLILTEEHNIGNSISFKGTFEFVKNYYDLAVSNNASISVYLYERWPALGADQAAWRAQLSTDLAAWESVADHVNDNRQSGQPEMLLIPGGQAMARLYDAIAAGEVPGVTDMTEIHEGGTWLTDLGDYYMGLLIHAVLTGTSPVGASNVMTGRDGSTIVTVDSSTAAALQSLAWETVQSYARDGVAPASGPVV